MIMDELAKNILSGRARGMMPSVVRGVTAIAEPLYTMVMRLRNVAYDRGWKKSFDAPVPVISVGNLTTGGTGKTPVVSWLARELRAAGRRSAVLLRGYKSVAGEQSDEQRLLNMLLNGPSVGTGEIIPIHASPDRVAGARDILKHKNDVDVIILDDGFQHRRLRRAFDLVLIDATAPFGFDHVLPRGLLREPESALSRANAILLTRVDSVSKDVVDTIEQRVRRANPLAPIYRSSHVQSLPQLEGAVVDLKAKSIYAFCGIGNPRSFFYQLRKNGLPLVHEAILDDHHLYDQRNFDGLSQAAIEKECDFLLTTEKDWMKLANFSRGPSSLPIATVGVEVQFEHGDDARLFADVTQSISRI